MQLILVRSMDCGRADRKITIGEIGDFKPSNRHFCLQPHQIVNIDRYVAAIFQPDTMERSVVILCQKLFPGD